LAAERLTAAPKHAVASNTHDPTFADVASFVAPPRADAEIPRFRMSVWADPFGGKVDVLGNSSVASAASRPTVPSSSARSGGLTAILISDERRVAVIDDATVGVGDVLRDGARVSAIQPDRVWVVEKTGRWRMLTLSNRSTR
jgi:hypothetical protein